MIKKKLLDLGNGNTRVDSIVTRVPPATPTPLKLQKHFLFEREDVCVRLMDE